MSLQLDSVAAGYGRLSVLHDVSFCVENDHTLAILGPNGAGKTTLLKSIVGVLPTLSGRVILDGEDVTGLRTPARADRGIAWVPEGRRLFASLSVGENLMVAARRVDDDERERRLTDVLELFPDLVGLLPRPAWALSGGQQQMVAISRALMARPRVLLLDEPSLGLAPIIVKLLMAALDALGEHGQTMVLVEQNVKAGLHIADDALVLSRGRVVRRGRPADLLADADLRQSYLTGTD